MAGLFAASPLVALAVLTFTTAAFAGDVAPVGVRDRTIGYVITTAHWAVYQTTDAKAECPDGRNLSGPREQFKAEFPNGGTVADTHLKREAASWFPRDHEDKFPFHEAKGKISYGLNLDGQVGPNDFTSPQGDPGVDNQLYRAIGCLNHFRGPDGVIHFFSNKFLRDFNYNRTLIELTSVDSLANDDDVDVAIYRGVDRLMTDATGDTIMPGGTQRIDARFGKKFERHTKGKIVGGVLVTDPTDAYWPWATFDDVPGTHFIRAMRLSLKLAPESAGGVLGGYMDVDAWYNQMITAWSTHHLSYGQVTAPSLYRVLRRLADGYPDKDGANTAISGAINVTFAQVFIQHPPQQTAHATMPDAAGR
jgi:hypothetical protein